MTVIMKPKAYTRRRLRAGAYLLAAVAIVAPQTAHAEETATLLRAPATTSPPAANLAVSFELKFRLGQGGDLSDLLLQAGVDPDDIAIATRLAAGHDGGRAGCYVKVSATESFHKGAFRLQRLTLMTETSQTVMERRKGELTISTTGARTPSIIV